MQAFFPGDAEAFLNQHPFSLKFEDPVFHVCSNFSILLSLINPKLSIKE